MNENDLRDCFAMFIVNGIVSRGVTSHTDLNEVAENAYKLADAMVVQRSKEPEQEIGIVAAKTRRKK